MGIQNNIDAIDVGHNIRSERFKEEIGRSILNSVCYDFSKGSQYELGFRRHSGIVSRVIPINITAWLRNNLDACLGKTCILNFAHYTQPDWLYFEEVHAGVEDMRNTTTLYEVLAGNIEYYGRDERLDTCLYTPGIVVTDGSHNSIGKVDVISCNLFNTGSFDLSDDIVKQRACNRIILVLHAAAHSKVDNIIVEDIGNDFSNKDLRWIIGTIKSMSELYKCYLSNVFYIASDERKYQLYKEEISGK